MRTVCPRQIAEPYRRSWTEPWPEWLQASSQREWLPEQSSGSPPPRAAWPHLQVGRGLGPKGSTRAPVPTWCDFSATEGPFRDQSELPGAPLFRLRLLVANRLLRGL